MPGVTGTRRLLSILLTAGAAWAETPTREDVAPWLGSYEAGVDVITLRWEAGLVIELGNVVVPVDGEWHETVPEFVVRHRVSWDSDRRLLHLEERHDRGRPWRYELKLDESRERLLKFSPDEGSGGKGALVRTYRRVRAER